VQKRSAIVMVVLAVTAVAGAVTLSAQSAGLWIVISGSALTATLVPQIPERAQWEIRFAQVEASAGLSDMRTVPPAAFEARIMQRPWSARGPLPFLRLHESGGIVRAQLFVFWAEHRSAPGRQPKGPDIVCREGVCVRPIDMKEQREWREVVANLADQDACPTTNAGHCGDCNQIWIKTAANGKYREQSCQAPGADTAAGVLLQLLTRSARAAGY
jgi:hypothetical protein